MTNLTDPAVHRLAERKLIEHVQRLLDDPKLRIDTTEGTRPVAGLRRSISRADRADEIRKLLASSEANPDLASQLPRGERLEITFSRPRLLVFGSATARLTVVSTSPWKQLLAGQPPRPTTGAEINRLLEEGTPGPSVPTTFLLLSTGGFAPETHEMAQRVASRTLVMIEPNSAGGFSLWGPAEFKALTDLLDPETQQEKRNRVREYVKANDADLSETGLPADRCVNDLMLPFAVVDDEFKAIAKSTRDLTAKRLDGRMVLYRHGAKTTGVGVGAANPLAERIKSVFGGRTSHEKRIAFMTERRQAILDQRSALDDEMQLLEKKDGYLREQFREATSDPARRRAAAQLYHVRRQLDRRQGLEKLLNQQLNAASDHLEKLELLQNGGTVQLDPDQIAAETMLTESAIARIKGEIELTESGPVNVGTNLSPEEQELFDELTRDTAGG